MWTETRFVKFENSGEAAGKRKGNSISGLSVNIFDEVKKLRNKHGFSSRSYLQNVAKQTNELTSLVQ